MARDKRFSEYEESVSDLEPLFDDLGLDDDTFGSEKIARQYAAISEKGRYTLLSLIYAEILPSGTKMSCTRQFIDPSGKKTTERIWATLQDDSTIKDDSSGKVYSSPGSFKGEYYNTESRLAEKGKKHYPDGWRDVSASVSILGLGRKTPNTLPSLDDVIRNHYLELHSRGITHDLLERKSETALAAKLSSNGYGKQVNSLDEFIRKNPTTKAKPDSAKKAPRKDSDKTSKKDRKD